MKTEDKLILFFYLILLTCFFSIFIILPFGYFNYDNVLGFVNGILNDYRWYYFALAILLIALNIKLIISLIFGENIKKVGVIKYTSMGELNISFETIKALVIKTASGARGIRDIKVMIRPGRDNINIMIKTLILPDVNIPQTIKEVQESVKAYVEAMTEIPVGEVKVIVTDVASNTKLRLQ